MQTPPFNTSTTEFAYQLHYHIGFRTRRSVAAFGGSKRATFLQESLYEICERDDYHILELDVSDCWTRLLVSLRPSHSPAKFVQTVKANSSRLVFEKFPEVESEMGRRSLWSRGYYARSVGSVTDQTVLGYVAKQAEHHVRQRGDSRLLASYEHPNPQEFFDLRPFAHCVAEYNCHLVFCPLGHVPAIDPAFANDLQEYIFRIAASREFDVISLAVLDDHVHLFAALRPHQSPEYLAFAVMNNTSHWMVQRNPGALKLWNAPALWSPSAYVGTAGAVTTDVVRAHVKSRTVVFDE